MGKSASEARVRRCAKRSQVVVWSRYRGFPSEHMTHYLRTETNRMELMCRAKGWGGSPLYAIKHAKNHGREQRSTISQGVKSRRKDRWLP